MGIEPMYPAWQVRAQNDELNVACFIHLVKGQWTNLKRSTSFTAQPGCSHRDIPHTRLGPVLSFIRDRGQGAGGSLHANRYLSYYSL